MNRMGTLFPCCTASFSWELFNSSSNRAEESAAEAEAAKLANVRERALRSEKTWRGLAEQARKVEHDRAKAERERAERREAERMEQAETASASGGMPN